MPKIKKLDGKSYNPQEELLNILKKQASEIFTDSKINCDKLKRTLGEEVNIEDEQYGLNWHGKSDCFREIQQQTTATLKPDKNESVDFDKTENIFIEGDNLEVLKILQKSYYGKIKMIYIDPPYNTGNDFIYNDKFKQERAEYEKENGIKDGDGNLTKDGLIKNTKDSGHYHSNWLDMMYPRLFLARNLLKQDGVIFVSIDDNEVHNLRMIMNEIFGEEKFIGQLPRVTTIKGKNDEKQIATSHDYVLVYGGLEVFARNKEFRSIDRYKLEDDRGKYYVEATLDAVSLPYQKSLDFEILMNGKIFSPIVYNGKKTSWRWSKDLVNFGIKNDLIVEKNGRLYTKTYLEYEIVKTSKGYKIAKKEVGGAFRSQALMEYKFSNNEASRSIKELKIPFDYSKPISLIEQLTKFIPDNMNDIIVDFFAGSGTTAHAIMALNAEDGGNRKCISVQLPEITDEKSEAYKAGYKNIADIAKERIRRAGKKIMKDYKKEIAERKEPLDIGFKAFKLDESNFKIWRKNIKDEKELMKQMNLFVDNVKKGGSKDNLLYELILKSGLDLNVDIEKKKVDQNEYYLIDEGKLSICLEDKINKKLIDSIIADKPEKFICLDKAFGNNDQLKTNTNLQMQSAKIEFKVI